MKAVTPHEFAVQEAQIAARSDHAKGLARYPNRHGARSGSAWAKWYSEEYDNIPETDQ